MRHLFCKSGKRLSFILCAVLLLSILGCGQQDETGTVHMSGTDINNECAEDTKIGTEWKTKGFSYKESFGSSDALEETAVLQEIRSSRLVETEPGFIYVTKQSVVAYLRDTCYTLYSYEQQQGQRFLLEKRQSDVEETEQLELFSAVDEVPVGYVACMDIITESDIAVLFIELADNQKGEPLEYLLLHLDGEGTIISRTELLDSYQQQGIGSDDLFQGFWQCDEQGYSYVLTNERKTLTIFDANGSFVMTQDYSREECVTIEAAFHAPDGSLIFALTDSQQGTTKLVWFDLSKKQCKELVSMGTPYLRQFTMLENGQIYYSRGSMLYKWDVQTGKQEPVFSYLASNIPYSMLEYVEHVSVIGEEELLLYVLKSEGRDMCVLSTVEQETEGITLVDFIGEAYVQSCAANYSRSNSDMTIQYSRSSGDKEAFWTRTMAELAAGKGPDMICLWATDENLQILYKKGVLADLAELIPEETREQIFPGILESGSVNGDLVGLGLEGMPFVVITSNKLWQDKNWTAEDVLKIVEEEPDLEGIVVLRNGETSAYSNLFFTAGLGHLENAPFWNLQERESYFETVQFQKALELAKEYSEAPKMTEEVSTLIKEGRCLATFRDVYIADNFVNIVEEYGEECHFMGYPGQTDYSGYWNSVYLIVVNKQSKYLDTIAEFLEYLLDIENQQKIVGATGVREDVVRQSVYWDEWSEKWVYKTDGDGSCYFEKPNGDSYIEDYIAFLKNLGPWVSSYGVISDIVSEETKDYFDGVRNAEQTAMIIDNRIQLYLDEQ